MDKNLINLQHLYYLLSGATIIYHDLDSGFLWIYNGLSRITAIDAAGKIIYQQDHEDIGRLAFTRTKAQSLAKRRINKLRKEGESNVV